MKLLTGYVEGEPLLFRDLDQNWLEITGALPQLAEIRDVGALLRSGLKALEAARGLASGTVRHAHEFVLAPPVLSPSKIICIGLNYARHAAESGVSIPKRPIVFAKFPNTLVGAGAAVVKSRLTAKLDYEAELAVVIGRRAHRVNQDRALDYVGGYMNANDISARDLQAGDDASQWVFGKTLDTFCPTGPYLVTPDELPQWREIRIRAWVNDELRQDESCSDMIFGVEELIAYLSAGMELSGLGALESHIVT